MSAPLSSDEAIDALLREPSRYQIQQALATHLQNDRRMPDMTSLTPSGLNRNTLSRTPTTSSMHEVQAAPRRRKEP
jgi:hypothetical protein